MNPPVANPGPATPRFPAVPSPPIGVLLANTGTPDSPAPADVRRYLRQFLWDRRIVDLPRPLWWVILNGVILPFRPRASARLYRKIWTRDGSPLLLTSLEQARAVEGALNANGNATFTVSLGMRYGAPSIAGALGELRDKECNPLIVLPMFPQYCSATTAAIFDAVAAEIARWHVVPEVRFISRYHDEIGYTDAIDNSVRQFWKENGETERVLFSFHGTPERFRAAGDPYFWQCHHTSRRVATDLGLRTDCWQVAFQSRFGRGEWLKPYTVDVLREWAREGVTSVDVICPGFAADCLETLEEIAIRYGEVFLGAGGKRFRYIPALNDRPDHIDVLAGVIRRRSASVL